MSPTNVRYSSQLHNKWDIMFVTFPVRTWVGVFVSWKVSLLLRGHSSTTLTTFWPFFWPPTFACWYLWRNFFTVKRENLQTVETSYATYLKSDRKRMLLFNNCYKIVSGHFFAICIFIFHKTEVQTVILRCLTGLNYNWFKSYGLRCSWRSLVSLVNFWKIASDKWPILRTHLAFFWKLHDYLWQNWDSEGHFEVLNKSKS